MISRARQGGGVRVVNAPFRRLLRIGRMLFSARGLFTLSMLAVVIGVLLSGPLNVWWRVYDRLLPVRLIEARVTPDSLRYGEWATIAWDAPRADRVAISGPGFAAKSDNQAGSYRFRAIRSGAVTIRAYRLRQTGRGWRHACETARSAAVHIIGPDDVTIIPKRPPPMVRVPDLVGKTIAQARQQAIVAHLRILVPEGRSNKAPKDTLLRQDPPGGALATKGSAVHVIVSLGPPPPAPMIQVPSLIGKTLAQARREAGALGLAIGMVSGVPSATAPLGTVVAVHPPAGARVKRDRVQTLAATVSTGPPAPVMDGPAYFYADNPAFARQVRQALGRARAIRITHLVPALQQYSLLLIGPDVPVDDAERLLRRYEGPVVVMGPSGLKVLQQQDAASRWRSAGRGSTFQVTTHGRSIQLFNGATAAEAVRGRGLKILARDRESDEALVGGRSRYWYWGFEAPAGQLTSEGAELLRELVRRAATADTPARGASEIQPPPAER